MKLIDPRLDPWHTAAAEPGAPVRLRPHLLLTLAQWRATRDAWLPSLAPDRLSARVPVGVCLDNDAELSDVALNDWLRSTPVNEVARVLGAEAAVIGRLAPAVHAILTDLAPLADLGPDEAEARLNDAIGQVLTRMTVERPAVLVLADLHWADAATVSLLRVVARKATTMPLLVVGTYRDTDLDRRHPLAEALPLLRREVEPSRLALHGLPAESVRELLERLADHEVPEAFAAMLAEQTDGNPFFLREMLIHLTDVGALRFEEGVWVARSTCCFC